MSGNHETLGAVEHSLRRWLNSAAQGWSDERLSLALRHLGWVNAQRLPLRDLAIALGISRQAAHESVSRFTERLRRRAREADFEDLQHVLDSFFTQLPIRVDRAFGELDQDESRPLPGGLSPTGILECAAIAGLVSSLRIEQPYLLDDKDTSLPVKAGVAAIARDLVAAGACSIHAVLAELDESQRWAAEDLFRDAEEAGVAVEVDFPWVTSPPGAKNRIVDLAYRILSVAGTSPVGLLIRACERQVRAGRAPYVPPERVIFGVLETHGFILRSGEFEAPHVPSPADVLSSTELAIWSAMGEQPGGMLARSQVIAAVEAAGLSRGSAEAAMSYSAVLTRVARGKWAFVGEPIRTRPVPAVGAQFAWQTSGELSLSARLISVVTDELPIPAAVARLVADGVFTSTDRDLPHLLVRRQHISGLHQVVRRLGFRGDEVITLFLDLSRREWRLRQPPYATRSLRSEQPRV